MGEHYNIFVENGFDGNNINRQDLDEKDLRNMGISKIGHRKLILHKIKQNKKEEVLLQANEKDHDIDSESNHSDSSSESLYDEGIRTNQQNDNSVVIQIQKKEIIDWNKNDTKTTKTDNPDVAED